MIVRALLAGLLTLALVASALSLVKLQHERRALFAELRRLERDRDELLVEWGRLQLEHSTLADPERIERLARSELGLVVPAAAQLRLIAVPETLPAASSGTTPTAGRRDGEQVALGSGAATDVERP